MHFYQQNIPQQLHLPQLQPQHQIQNVRTEQIRQAVQENITPITVLSHQAHHPIQHAEIEILDNDQQYKRYINDYVGYKDPNDAQDAQSKK